MSWGKVKKINSDMSKALNVLIAEKTNIRIQTVSFYFSKSITETATGTIETIDTSKSIIIPISPVVPNDVASLAFNFSTDGSSVSATVRYPSGSTVVAFSYTVAVVTFGATVV